MNLKSTSALILAGAVLAGCGSGGGSVSSNTFGGIYEPNFRDGSTTEIAALEDGIVFFIGNIDGTVTEHFVRLERGATVADDRLFVSTNGGPEVEYAQDPTQTNNTASLIDSVWINVDPNIDDEFQVVVDTSDLFSGASSRDNVSGITIGPRNEGFGGLETQIADLPTSATYSGTFEARTASDPISSNSEPGIVTDTSNTVVDFANGTISGQHAGTSFLGAGGSINGDIAGSVSGSRVTGTLSVEDSATGTLNFGGLATGAQAENIRGGVAGTLNDGTSDHTVGGSFCLGQSAGCMTFSN